LAANRCAAVHTVGEVCVGSQVALVEGEVPGAHACGHHDGGHIQRLLHLQTYTKLEILIHSHHILKQKQCAP
jgi:hypothetical protein